MANVIALMMRKGGAGKTTLTLLLADALARFGLRVLVIDLDPQGNASIGLGKKVQLETSGTTRLGGKAIMTPTTPTVIEVIDADADGIASEAIQIVDWGYAPEDAFYRGGPLFPGKIGTIGLISCYRALEIQAQSWRPSDLERLAKAVLLPSEPGGTPPNHEWDVVLVDTPPGGSLISVQAAMAAHHALLVTQAQRFGVEAIPETLLLVEDVRESYRRDELEVIGLVFNEYVDRSNTQQNLIAQVRDAQEHHAEGYDVPLLKGRLPGYTVVDKSQNAEAPLSAYLGSSSDRETARRVSQVAEGIAIQVIEAINHPQAAEIRAAWKTAWPESMRTPILEEV
ncbi:ParA family protein [Streptosporangium lutulentum]|uniref:Cellulose biosynthesis protein BcsQ n=1 Tax=Streptosporangium lutulentum TaxID=1461250 RepID=A0ABT9QUB1_9ACTN|nr:ParA family protein [Streptosporangium lutulentum]MDP9850347.1 cellulose biosynthesis protein BcsQ [Streptosporangium lutulentum]